MRLAWFKNLSSTIQVLILSGLLIIFVAFYVSLSQYIKPAITSSLSPPLKLFQGISSNARHFLRFQDLTEENRRLKARINKLNAQLAQLQEARLENQRLRSLFSLPQRESFQTCAALLIGKDSSNWTNIVMINKGALSGVKCGMPVVLGANLVGKVIETAPRISKVVLLIDFNSKIPAKILRTREEGVVFGTAKAKKNICKMKYIQEIKIGDKVISSGLGRVYPKGLLIGEVIAVQEQKNRLYKVAEVHPAVDFSTLEEVMVITSQ